MFSDRDALLAAIRTNPDEDTPRLVFADWLDENGDPDRAEFIRGQCELAGFADENSGSYAMYEFLHERYALGLAATDWTRIDAGVHRLVTLAARADDLLKQHGAKWLPKLAKKYKVQWGGFCRGFPHRVAFQNIQKVVPVAERLREAVPPVTLIDNNFTADTVARLAEAGLLGWIAGLEVDRDCAAGLHALGQQPEARNLRSLTVRYGDANDFALVLADAPHLTGLRELDLSETYISAGAAESLFQAKHLHTLRRLHVRGSGDWTADTVRVLTAGGFTNLTSLLLAHCQLDDDAAETLANCPDLANVRSLDLAHNRIGGRGATALLCSPHLANVAYLGLDGNPCTVVDADRLAATPPAALRLLNCHGCRFRAADVRALVQSPRLRTLWYLDFDDNNLGVSGVRALIRGFGNWCPPILWLIRNRIDDRCVQLLANWKTASGLSALHVKYNPLVTDAGIRALLDSPNLTNLDALGVPEPSAETETRLRARFKYPDGY